MAMFGVGLCLLVLFLCAVSTSVVQGRNLRRRHNHHSHPDYYPNFKELMPRDFSRRFENDLEYQQNLYKKQMERPESSRILDRSAEYKERILPLHRYKHVYNLRKNYGGSLRRKNKMQKNIIDDALTKIIRRKRHNKRSTVIYDILNSQDSQAISKQQHLSTNSGLNESYELEVKEAQNSSICNYTIVSDTRATRIPKDLEHIKCNHAGSKCQGTSAYCCIQTFKLIKVSYGNGEKKDEKLYVGCVCALSNISIVESTPRIND